MRPTTRKIAEESWKNSLPAHPSQPKQRTAKRFQKKQDQKKKITFQRSLYGGVGSSCCELRVHQILSTLLVSMYCTYIMPGYVLDPHPIPFPSLFRHASLDGCGLDRDHK